MLNRLCFGALLLACVALPFTGCTAPSGLDSITISPSTVTVTLAPPGAQQGHGQFTAIGYYGHAGHQTTMDITNQVTWSSSLTQVATINSSGLATATGFNPATGEGWTGYTNITATAPGFNGTIVSNSATFTVTACTACINTDVSAVTVIPATQTVATVGVPVQFEAIGMTINGVSVPLTNASGIRWVSSAPTVATINAATGLATTAGAGTATITATYINPDGSGATGSATLTVAATGSAEPLTSLTVAPNAQTALSIGQTAQFLAIATTGSGSTVNLTNQTATVGTQTIQAATWVSSDPSVATINSATGVVTSVAAGATVITAIAENPDKSVVTGAATYTVTPSSTSSSEPLVSIAILPAAQTSTSTGTAANVTFFAIGTTGAGGTVLLSNAVQTVNGQTIDPVSWSSSNPLVASFASSSSGTATPNASGATAIIAVVANPDKTVVTGTAAYTVTASSSSSEPLTAVTIYPPSPSVSAPNETSQLLAIGTFSSAPTTQDVTDGITNLDGVANQNITTNWSSSNTAVATVTTACPTGISAESCTISDCPPGSTGATCTTCPAGTVAAGSSCAQLNLATPIGIVTGVSKGSTVIMSVSKNPDGTLVPATTSFSVLGGTTEAYTALTIYPGSQAATAPAQHSQFFVLGTQGSTGLQYDVTSLVQWCSSNATVATVESSVAGSATCSNVVGASPGTATSLGSGNTTITAIYTNPDNSKLTASASYSVTIGQAQEPLISINVVPATLQVFDKGQTGQFLAFGTYSSTPTVRDLTNEVTWYTSSPELATIDSTGVTGETGGLATAMGYTGNAVIYAFMANPDGTVVISNPVQFTCEDPYTQVCDPGPAKVLLATLTVYNAGENQTTWLVTAPSDTQATCDAATGCLIHCGPGSEIAGYGNSVCTGTYAAGSVVTLTVSPFDAYFGGWSSNCDTTATTITTVFTVSSVTFGTNTATIVVTNMAGNTMSVGDVGEFLGLTGNASVLNGLYFTVTAVSSSNSIFQIAYSAVTPGGPYSTGGTFTTKVNTPAPDAGSTCSFTLNGDTSVGALFYGLDLSCSAVTSGNVGVPFKSGAITVSGGTAPFTFSVVGTLPAGLTLNTATGAVTGTPTVSGSFSIAAANASTTASSTCPITIN